jgi:nitroreductase
LCLEAAAVFIWTAVFERSKWKYEQRGYRYVYMDAGHICENLYLAATGLGLGACAIGALYDDDLNAILGVDGVVESAIYMCAAGNRRLLPRAARDCYGRLRNPRHLNIDFRTFGHMSRKTPTEKMLGKEEALPAGRQDQHLP